MDKRSQDDLGSDWHGLNEVLGYGQELADALNRFLMAADENSVADALKDHYKFWLQKCPHFKNICFVDLTFFGDEGQEASGAMSVVVTSDVLINGEPACEEYVKFLNSKYFFPEENGGHTLALHPDFASGLVKQEVPSSFSTSSVETTDRLTGHKPQSGYVLRHLPPSETFLPSHSKPEAQCHLDKTYDQEERIISLKYRISNEPFTDQWENWCDLWGSEEGQAFVSSNGFGPNWLLAAPITIPHPLQGHEVIACIFIGFDSGMSSDEITESLRYILLNLYEANCTARAARTGEMAGRMAAYVPVAHELQYITKAILPNLSDLHYRIIRGYLGEITSAHSSLVEVQDQRDERLSDSAFINKDWRGILQECVVSAGRVRGLAQAALHGGVTGASIDACIGDTLELLASSVTFLDGTDGVVTAPPHHIELLKLAVGASLRNVLKHAPPGEPILLRFDNESGLLIITNKSLTTDPPRKVKEGGTLMILKAYTRSFGGDPRLVSIQTIGEIKKVEGHFHAVWDTTIPFGKQWTKT